MKLFKREIKKISKNVGKNFGEIEGWMTARRKFFIRLSIVTALITVLIIYSHLYLR